MTVKFLGIRAKILLPWILVLCGLFALAALHEFQTSQADASRAHARLHQNAVQLARELRDLAQERWMRALSYRSAPEPRFSQWLAHSYAQTDQILERLNRQFDNSPHGKETHDADESSPAESYRLAAAGHAQMYERYIAAIGTGDVALQQKLTELLVDKLRIVVATLDDLNQYHIKTAQQVEAQELLALQGADRMFISALALLIGIGLLLAYFQSRSVVRPLTMLTVVAHRIELGETVDLTSLRQRSDEIGRLSDALDRMVAELRRVNAQLVAAYGEIEVKVDLRTRELARRTEELEQANRDLEGFSYSVSHDLRAPLRAIDGFVAILTEDHVDKLDDEAKRLFGVVAENARRMGELIDDILAFSRAGRLELHMERVDMNRLVDEVCEALAPVRGNRLIEFRRASLIPAYGDPRALRQVWQNLLDNAIKFTRNRSPAVIEIGSREEDDRVIYSVRDNGVGFNPAYGEKLFGLFQRLHGMEEFPGTGVGLCLVKRFVEKHQGTVSAQGRVDEGACFSFSIPREISTFVNDPRRADHAPT